jgi:hypothetical protein
MMANVLLFLMFSAIASLNIGVIPSSSHQGNRLSAARETAQKKINKSGI